MKKILLFTSLTMSLTLFGCVQYEDGEPVKEPEEDISTAEAPAGESETNEESVDEESADEMEDSESASDSLPENISELHISDVRNDDTGKFKKAVTSDDINMPENSVAYYNEYMEDGEIHYIVNLGNNTTTTLNNMGDQIFVTVTEYVDKEEHDANKIGSGMVLEDYIVSLTDGTIEKL